MKKFNKVIAGAGCVLFVAASFAACSLTWRRWQGHYRGRQDPKVKVIDIALSDEEYAFGVDKKQPELKEKANASSKSSKRLCSWTKSAIPLLWQR